MSYFDLLLLSILVIGIPFLAVFLWVLYKVCNEEDYDFD